MFLNRWNTLLLVLFCSNTTVLGMEEFVRIAPSVFVWKEDLHDAVQDKSAFAYFRKHLHRGFMFLSRCVTSLISPSRTNKTVAGTTTLSSTNPHMLNKIRHMWATNPNHPLFDSFKESFCGTYKGELKGYSLETIFTAEVETLSAIVRDGEHVDYLCAELYENFESLEISE